MISPELKWLWAKARPLRPLLLAQLCAVLAVSLLGLLDPLIIKWLIDDVLPWQKHSMLVTAAVTFAGVYFFRFGFGSLGMIVDAYLSQRLMLMLRLHLLRHVQGLSAQYFVETPPGDILHRLEQDVNQIRELGGGALSSLVRIVVSTSLTLVILLMLNWKLTLLVLPLVPLMLVLRNFGYPLLRRASDRVNMSSAARVSFFQELVQSVSQSQLLRREAGERRRFVGIARQGVEDVVRRRGYELFLEQSTSMSMMLGTAVVLGYGGSSVMAGTMTVGGLVAFYTYLSRVFGPAQTLVTLYSALQRAEASLRRIRTLLDVSPTIQNPSSPISFGGGAASPCEVRLKNVSFGFGENLILDRVDLTLRAGRKAVLIGATGSGKSSLVKLLVRLYDPQDGEVLLDGVTADRYSLRELRRQVALVLQDPLIFDVSVRENLQYADRKVSEQRLWEVLRLVQLDQVVAEMPEQLDTSVGVRGQKLSGGQKQRLAIARAVLQRPRLLILDEATAGLDTLTESALLEALDPLTQEMTILLIAHRPTAIRWAEDVFLFEQGRLVDHGDHETLNHRSEQYRQLLSGSERTGSNAAAGSEAS